MPIPEHVVRFWRAADELAGTVSPTWWGAIVVDPDIPQIWDANYARVDLPNVDVSAADVEAELVPALRRAGVETLHVVSFYPDDHRALLADLSTRGQRLSWDLVMDLAGPGGHRSDVVVEELPPDAALWPRLIDSFALFGVTGPGEADQLRRLEERLTEGGKRWFGVRDADGVVVSLAALLVLDGVGYVDNVATFPEARKHGYASAITARIAREARSARAEHVILLVDPDAPDVVRMYERLGFRDVGRLGSTRGPVPGQSTNL
jgi:ribosomal protein S18 acetylase RimI-like enzyme